MIEIIPLTDQEISQAAALEAVCFSDGVSEAALRAFVEAEANHYYAALENGEFCGYGGFSVAADEAEILSVAVAPYKRRRGIARSLMERMQADACALGATVLYLDVRSTNTAAIALYRAMGFSEIGVRRNYYTKPREDAILMRRLLSENG